MPYAKKKIRKKYYSMVDTKYNSTEDVHKKLQQLKGNIKLKIWRNISKYYDEMRLRKQNGNIQFEEDLFVVKDGSKNENCQEMLLLMIFLQTKPQTKKRLTKVSMIDKKIDGKEAQELK